MAAMDIEELLQPISAESPSGESLEYATEFGELTRAAEGKPEQALGDSTLPAEPPDWKVVQSIATALLKKSKDLRLAVYLLRASLNLNGLSGFAEGLTLVERMLAQYWDTLHPQLDPDDGNDPTFRVNTIATLVDREATLSALQLAPLVAVKGLGSFGLRHVLIAQGELPAGKEAAPDMATVNAAFMEVQSNDLLALEQSVSTALASLHAIDAQLMDKVGSAQAPNLGLLGDLLRQIEKTLKDFLSKRGIVQLAKSEDAAPVSATTAVQAEAVEKISGEIRSRHDAALMMDKISEYFTKHEPSSPVPLLMQRAKRVATMNFLDILKDLAPDGLAQAKNIGGIDGG